MLGLVFGVQQLVNANCAEIGCNVRTEPLTYYLWRNAWFCVACFCDAGGSLAMLTMVQYQLQSRR
jgi:hypothetical protein